MLWQQREIADRRPWARATIQLSKIRGAANGKVETSRGRKKPAQEYMGSAAGVSPQTGIFRVKREPLNPLYRKRKSGFGV